MKLINTKMTRHLHEQKQEILGGLVGCTNSFLTKEVKRRMKQHPKWSSTNALMSIYSARIGRVSRGYITYVRILASLTREEIKAIPIQLYAFITFLRSGVYQGVTFYISDIGKAVEKTISREVFRAKQRIANNSGDKVTGKPIGGTSRRLRRLRNIKVKARRI